MAPNKTDCIPEQFKFKPVLSCPIVVNLNGETVTSDAGLTLIAELDRKRKITSRLAQCVNRIDHSVSSRQVVSYLSLIIRFLLGFIRLVHLI